MHKRFRSCGDRKDDGCEAIRRIVTMLPGWAESLTESNNKAIAARIKDHVPNMESCVLEKSAALQAVCVPCHGPAASLSDMCGSS